MPSSFSQWAMPSSVRVTLCAFSSAVKQAFAQVFARVFGVDLLFFRDRAAFQVRDHAVDDRVFLGGLFGRAGDDQRRARLVDEDGVDFVYNRVGQTAENPVPLDRFGQIAQDASSLRTTMLSRR